MRSARILREKARSVTIRTTLFGLGIAALAYVAVVGLILALRIVPAAGRLQRQSEAVVTEFRDSRRRALILDSTRTDLRRMLVAARSTTLPTDALEYHRQRLQQMVDSLGTLQRLTSTDGTSAEMRRVLAAIIRDEARLRGALLGTISALELRDAVSAERLLSRADSLDAPIDDLAAKVTAIAVSAVNRHEADLATTARNAARLVGLWLVAGLAMLAVLAPFFRRRLHAPLAALDAGLERVAAGDLEVALTPARDDELGRLAAHFNRMTAVLRQRAVEEEQRTAHETAARTRLIIDSALDAVVVIDMGGAIREWTPQAEVVLGWSRDEVIGRSLAETIIPPEHRAAHVAGLEHFRLTGEGRLLNRRLELTALRKDGSTIPVELAITTLGRGTETEFSAFIRDIGERHAAQAALAASEERYRAAFEQAAVGMAEVAHDGRYLRVNRAFAVIVGRDRSELEGLRIEETGHPDELLADRSALNSLFAGESPLVQREKRYVRPDGSVAWVNLAATLVRGATGTPAYVLGIVEDVTERKRLEDELRQAQRMDAVGRLAGGIAHDFNNLLTGIIGYAELMRHAEGATEQTRDDATSIMSTAERGADLARNLLTLARRNPNREEPVDVHKEIREVADLVTRTFDRRIEVRLDLTSSASMVSGDRSQLGNAFLNLALNARDAMPDGGRLTFSSRVVSLDDAWCARHVDAPAPGRYLSVTVRDTGSGIPRETQARIFEPFFTTKPTGKGTGLGLAMVYGTVRSHHGVIEVESEPGRGAVFTILLPLASMLQGGDITNDEQPATGSGTILIADDEEMVRDVAARMLSRLGYVVEVVNDGVEAVARVRAQPDHFDLIVLDGNMPRLAGRDAARIIRSIRPELPLILASGYLEPGQTGVNDSELFAGIVPKPYTLDDLSRNVAARLQRAP